MKSQQICLYGSLFIYCLLASLFLSTPGLNSDEMLFGNAAQGLINNKTHHSYSINGFPIMVMPYIGALKAYLYYPIFKLFGVSVWTVRIPMIALTAFSLYFNAKTIALVYDKSQVFIFSALLLATNTSLIAMTRTDIGPIAIEFFCKSLATYLTLSYLLKNKYTNLYFLPIILFLGVFNKLNFIWFFNSLYAGIVLYLGIAHFFDKESSKLRCFKKNIPLLTAGLICTYTYYIVLNKSYTMLGAYFTKDWSIAILFDKISHIYRMVKGNFYGSIFYSYQYDGSGSYEKILGIFPSTNFDIYTIYCFECIILAILGYAIYLIIKSFKLKFITKQNAVFLFFLLNIVIQLVQTLPVSNANHAWHFFTIYPFLIFCTAIILDKISIKFFKYFAFSILLMININGYAKFISSFINQAPRGVWSTAIYELIDYTKDATKTFVCVTWGVEDQLITFHKRDDFLHGGLYPDSVFKGKDMYKDINAGVDYFSKTFIKGLPTATT